MNIVFFSAVSYDSVLGGRTRQLADILALSHRVDFVEMPSLRRPWPLAAMRRKNNLTIHHLPPLPWGWKTMEQPPGRIWRQYAASYLRKALAPESRAIVSTPYWVPLLQNLDLESVIYDCLDHVSVHAASPHAERAADLEARLVKRADRILAVSGNLTELWTRRSGDKVRFLPNGYPEGWLSLATFRPTSPVAGFFGALYEWVDYPLLEATASALPEVRFEFTGPVRDRRKTAGLQKMPNVHFHPPVPFDNAAGIMTGYSVGLIPFLRNPISEYCNPLKMYEYLSLGKAVISTIPGESGLPVTYAESPNDFIGRLREQLEMPPGAENLRKSVTHYTWRHIATNLERILQTI